MNMKKYVITLEWEVGSGREFELLKYGFNTLEQAQEKLKSLYEDEVANGWFDENDEDTTITKTETSWVIDVNYFDKYCQCEIVEIEFED